MIQMKKKYLNTSFIVIFLSLLMVFQKILGFVKQIFIANYFGTGSFTDVYQIAENFISLFRGGIVTSIAVTFLSIYSIEKNNKANISNSAEYKNNVFTIGIIISICISLLLYITSPLITKLLGYSLSSVDGLLMEKSIKILTITIPIVYMAAMIGSVLEGERIFFPSKTQGIFFNVSTIILTSLFFKKMGIFSIILAELTGLFLFLMFLFFTSIVKKCSCKLVRPKMDKLILRTLSMSVPIMISTSSISLNNFIDKIVAVKYQEGAASALQYANVLSIDAIVSVVITASSAILITNFTNIVINKDKDQLNSNINSTLFTMEMVILFMMIILMVFSKEVISIVFLRGSFNEESINLTSRALRGYSLGLIFYPLKEILLRVYYSYENSKTPFYINIIALFINIILTVALARVLGIFGITLATSISILFNGITLLMFYNYNNKYLSVSLDWLEGLKILVSGIVCLILSIYFKYKFWMYFTTIRIMFLFFILSIVYIISLFILKSRTLKFLAKSILKKNKI